MIDPAHRFSDRVENYVKYRPHYPSAIIDLLEARFNFDERKVVADVGSGTGISAELFLRNGNKVFGVEPNAPMRLAAETTLRHYHQFVSVAGSAEATTLPDMSCDVIVAGQAFHWFDRHRAKTEFQRIAARECVTVLLWNDRVNVSPFMIAYEEFIQRFAIDYNEVNHTQIADDIVADFLSPAAVSRCEFSHHRMMDFDGIKGLLLSSSYMPNTSHDRYSEMIEELRYFFNRFQENEVVRLEYVTRMYCGKTVS